MRGIGRSCWEDGFQLVSLRDHNAGDRDRDDVDEEWQARMLD